MFPEGHGPVGESSDLREEQATLRPQRPSLPASAHGKLHWGLNMMETQALALLGEVETLQNVGLHRPIRQPRPAGSRTGHRVPAAKSISTLLPRKLKLAQLRKGCVYSSLVGAHGSVGDDP